MALWLWKNPDIGNAIYILVFFVNKTLTSKSKVYGGITNSGSFVFVCCIQTLQIHTQSCSLTAKERERVGAIYYIDGERNHKRFFCLKRRK